MVTYHVIKYSTFSLFLKLFFIIVKHIQFLVLYFFLLPNAFSKMKPKRWIFHFSEMKSKKKKKKWFTSERFPGMLSTKLWGISKINK